MPPRLPQRSSKIGECEPKTGEREPTIGSRRGLARGLLLYRCSTALPMYRCGAWGLATPLCVEMGLGLPRCCGLGLGRNRGGMGPERGPEALLGWARLAPGRRRWWPGGLRLCVTRGRVLGATLRGWTRGLVPPPLPTPARRWCDRGLTIGEHVQWEEVWEATCLLLASRREEAMAGLAVW